MRQGQSQAGRVGGRPAGDRQGCIRIWITEVIQVLRRHSVAHQGGIWGPGSPPVSAPPYQVCAGGAAEQDVCRTLTIIRSTAWLCDFFIIPVDTAVTHYLLLLAEGQNFFALVCSKASWFTWFIPVPGHESYSAADRWYSSFETAATAASALTNKPRAMSMPAENAGMDTVVHDQFS